jgi:hypothetical protein
LPVRATCPPARLRRLRVLGPQPTLITEDCEESDFDGERFLNIAIQMIAQFFEAAHALQNFDGAETFREHAYFFSGVGQVTALYAVGCTKDIRPPGE